MKRQIEKERLDFSRDEVNDLLEQVRSTEYLTGALEQKEKELTEVIEQATQMATELNNGVELLNNVVSDAQTQLREAEEAFMQNEGEAGDAADEEGSRWARFNAGEEKRKSLLGELVGAKYTVRTDKGNGERDALRLDEPIPAGVELEIKLEKNSTPYPVWVRIFGVDYTSGTQEYYKPISISNEGDKVTYTTEWPVGRVYVSNLDSDINNSGAGVPNPEGEAWKKEVTIIRKGIREDVQEALDEMAATVEASKEDVASIRSELGMSTEDRDYTISTDKGSGERDALLLDTVIAQGTKMEFTLTENKSEYNVWVRIFGVDYTSGTSEYWKSLMLRTEGEKVEYTAEFDVARIYIANLNQDIVDGGERDWRKTVALHIPGEEKRLDRIENTLKLLEENGSVQKRYGVSDADEAVFSWIDDDFTPAISKAQEICTELGIRCSFAVIPDRPVDDYEQEIGEEKYIMLKSAYFGGNPVCVHPPHNGWYDSASGMEWQGIEKCRELLIGSLKAFMNSQVPHAGILVYPGSSDIQHPEVIDLAKDYMSLGVSAGAVGGKYSNDRNSNKWQLARLFINLRKDSRAVAWYKQKIDEAVAGKQWVIFGTHSGDWDNADADGMRPETMKLTKANVKEILAYAKSKAPFKTVDCVARERGLIK